MCPPLRGVRSEVARLAVHPHPRPLPSDGRGPQDGAVGKFRARLCHPAPPQRGDLRIRRHQRYTNAPFTLVAALPRCEKCGLGLGLGPKARDKPAQGKRVSSPPAGQNCRLPWAGLGPGPWPRGMILPAPLRRFSFFSERTPDSPRLTAHGPSPEAGQPVGMT